MQAEIHSHSSPRGRTKMVLALVFVVGMILAIRIPGLDRFATPDEAAWVGRSASFYYALAHRNYTDTFQHSHPGVTATWAGTFAYRWRYPALAWEATPRILKNWMRVEPFLREHGQDPIEILAAARLFMVLGTTAALGLAFWCAWRLLGLLPAFIGFLFIAFDPFHAGLTRLLHLDGLMGSLLLLSTLAFLCFLMRGRKIYDLLLAIVATGFAWLTKSPSLVLIPFLGLLFLEEIWRLWMERKKPQISDVWRITWPFLVWGLGSIAIFATFWPAMWVDPLSTLQKMFDVTLTYAVEGHSTPVFFNGSVFNGDPGWSFYPVNYLWRTTPAVLVGLVSCLLAYLKRWRPLDDRGTRRVVLFLAVFALLFTIQMSVGAKKFDRYLIPSFLPLDLLAGIGWAGLLGFLWHKATSRAVRAAILGILFLVIGSQAFLTLSTYPYYINYYNPLLGGNARAPQVMMIGWGEGLDQAASYLNRLPAAQNLKVVSYYPDGSFSYFFDGKTFALPDEWKESEESNLLSGIDYAVLYEHQWQRQVPDAKMLSYFDRLIPEYVVEIDGLEYARIYNLAGSALDP